MPSSGLVTPKGLLAASEEVRQRQNYEPASSLPTKTRALGWFGLENTQSQLPKYESAPKLIT